LTKTLDFRPYTDKEQIRPLVREGAIIRQDHNFQRVNKHLVMSPGRGSTPRHTDWPTVSRKLTLTLTRLQLKPAATYTSLSTQQATASIGFSSTGKLVLLPVTSDRRSCATGRATSHGRFSSQLRRRTNHLARSCFITTTRPVKQSRAGCAPG
jgi:hypothetical protein